MNLVKRDGFSDWLPKEIEDLFDRPSFSRINKSVIPAVNITESPTEYDITVSAPGINKEDMSIKVTDGVLELSYTHKEKEQQQEKKYLAKEFVYRSFDRKIVLPKDVDADKINAAYENGLVKITLPKNQTPAPASKNIEIK